MSLFAAFIAGVVAVSCSEEPEAGADDGVVEIVESGGAAVASEERIAVPVAIVGGGVTPLDAALSRRCTLRGELSSDMTGVVIVGNDDLETNTDAIVAAYGNGAIIVVTNRKSRERYTLN